jgi:outer membrane protein OmpA-like peptidoglycan-associated protein
MRAKHIVLVPLLLALAAAPATAETAAERCTAALQRLEAAIAARDQPAIESAANAAILLPGCDDLERGRLRRLASRTLTELAQARQAKIAPGDYLMRLTAARHIGQVWQTLLAIADVYYDGHQYEQAALAYQEAFTAEDEAYPDEPKPSRETVDWTFERAAETQMLAPNIAPPKRDGSPGGVDAILEPGGSRNLDVVARPLPVTFETGTAEMTADGKSFAEQWRESLRAGSFRDLLLIGHTDLRASDAYNDPLSVRRAEALGKFLKNAGFAGTIRTLGFGRRCPIEFSSGANYTQEQQWQILRRVDVISGDELPAKYCPGQKPVAGAVLAGAP